MCKYKGLIMPMDYLVTTWKNRLFYCYFLSREFTCNKDHMKYSGMTRLLNPLEKK